jgi:hypothetical protein
VTSDPVDIVYCEVCNLPHRRGVAVCEDCRHFLGTLPSWERLRAAQSTARNHALLGGLGCLALAGGALWLSGGAYAVVALGLALWSARAALRWRVLAKRVPKPPNLAQRW